MNANQVVTGELYRVSGRAGVAIVRLTRKRDGKPGWDGIDIATRRGVTVASAKRVLTRCDRNGKALESALAIPADRAKPARKKPAKRGRRRSAEDLAEEIATAADAKTAGKSKAKGGRKAKAKRRKVGILDLAARLLAQGGKPQTPAQLVATALEQKLWSTSGKTPAATLYAAIIREISRAGDQARFRKTAPNTFEATAAGRAWAKNQAA